MTSVMRADRILGNFLDASGMNTIRANQSALNLSIKIGSNSLQIGTPRAFGLIVGVTDVVANGAAFSADRTNPRHSFSSLSWQ
jgi:hypothetical protein